MKTFTLTGYLLVLSLLVYGQNHFERLDFLIGNWQGIETGVAGDGIGFRTYKYDLNGNFIREKNQSHFPKSTEKPIGEVHRDFGIYSYNSNTGLIVFRQFHVEGFTNIYELDEALSTENKLVFLTREIENNPGNWKARSTITKISESEFMEEFEIAMDGETYSPVIKNHWFKEK